MHRTQGEEVSEVILIVGGYGDVGAFLGPELIAAQYDQIRVAGRSEKKARDMAQKLGESASWVVMDVHDADSVDAALEGVGTVVGCIDQREYHLLREVVRRGLRYVDVTASREFIETGLGLSGEAQSSGARVLLAAGLTPGLINMMARRCADAVGGAQEVHTHGLFSTGDSYGLAAVRFMLQAMPKPYTIMSGGVERVVRCFGAHRDVSFPAPVEHRRVFLYAYPDQFFYPRTLGAHTSTSWFALEPPWVTKTIAWMLRLGGRFFLKFKAVQWLLLKTFSLTSALQRGEDQLMFSVEVTGPEGTCWAGVRGHGEGAGTGISAGLMLRELLENDQVPPGVWLPEQVISLETYMPAMAERGWRVELRLHEKHSSCDQALKSAE